MLLLLLKIQELYLTKEVKQIQKRYDCNAGNVFLQDYFRPF